MINRQRKVSFYQLVLERQTLIQESNTMQITELSNIEAERYFSTIYQNNMLALANGTKAIDVETSNNTYVIEVIRFADHKVFAKIGQQNAANTVGLRDMQTLELEDVPMNENQLLELFTYCFIDFETGIVSYIGINGAPKISAIRGLFDRFLNQDDIHAKLAAIMTSDILQTLIRKDIISKISVTVAVPSDVVLGEDIGLSATDFDALRNVKTRTATYKMVATRNKNILQTSSQLSNLFTSIRTRFGDNLNNINVNAKNFNEPSQTYDLLQYNFTKTVALGNSENHNNLHEEDFIMALETTYNTNRDELMRYIR